MEEHSDGRWRALRTGRYFTGVRDMTHHDKSLRPCKASETVRDKSSAPSSTVVARGPGFVVWLSASNGKTEGFITWTETAVAELSPRIHDAWRFPSVKAANDSVACAFGAAIENYAVAIFPASP